MSVNVVPASVYMRMKIARHYVPITLTNSQSTATPAPFQQLITINPSLYTPYLNTDLGNIRFYADANFTYPLYSWVENGNRTSTSANIWVNLPNGIGANSSITIYMLFSNLASSFEFDGVYAGQAPQLSPTYGQYDNGANVFNNYWNFAGTSLPSNLQETVLSNPSGASGSYSVNNGLTISNTNGADLWNNQYMITLVYFTSTVSLPQIFETKITSLTGNSGDSGWTKAGILYQNSITDTSNSNGEVDMVVTTSNGYAFQWQSGTSYIAPSGNSNGGTISYPTILALIAESSSSIGGFYGTSLSSLTQKGVYVTPTSIASSGYIGLFVTAHNSAGTSSATFQYMLTRAYPPNGVMPSVSIGNLI